MNGSGSTQNIHDVPESVSEAYKRWMLMWSSGGPKLALCLADLRRGANTLSNVICPSIIDTSNNASTRSFCDIRWVITMMSEHYGGGAWRLHLSVRMGAKITPRVPRFSNRAATFVRRILLRRHKAVASQALPQREAHNNKLEASR
jgi:hypothetical protein